MVFLHRLALTWPQRSSPTPIKIHQNHWLRVSPEQLKGFPPNSTMMIYGTGENKSHAGSSEGCNAQPREEKVPQNPTYPLSWDDDWGKDLVSTLAKTPEACCQPWHLPTHSGP